MIHATNTTNLALSFLQYRATYKVLVKIRSPLCDGPERKGNWLVVLLVEALVLKFCPYLWSRVAAYSGRYLWCGPDGRL
jgi:hypothetical protein